ncbi:P3IP1 protein, partial [Syrrhaptes paradoxus]|nr:P3IP1 protein [Syrrhaptes paradoxus]
RDPRGRVGGRAAGLPGAAGADLMARPALSAECLRGNGASYRGSRREASGGAPCLNWLAVRSGPGAALPAGGSGGRGGDGGLGELAVGKIAGAGSWGRRGRSPADGPVPSGNAPAATAPAPTAEVGTSQKVNQVFEPADTLPSRSEAAAVQPIIGISQRVQMNSKEKKDLGTLGYVLGLIMMVIIIAIGAGIVVGYIYKRGKDLKEKHEQKVYEREMQRITLPLSAFTNPACELVDENTIVVHTNQTPVEDTRDGSGLLMGQAGTPGA